VLYELLTANRPFAGENDSRLIDNILHQRPWPLEKFLGAVSAPMQKAVEKMLAKDPQDRYQTLYEFLCDLESFEKHTSSASDTRVMAAPHPAVPSIAILPFRRSGERLRKLKNIFCDGLAEEIMSSLARLKGRGWRREMLAYQFKAGQIRISLKSAKV
jgi:serine/threonine protein kinase